MDSQVYKTADYYKKSPTQQQTKARVGAIHQTFYTITTATARVIE
jgi:hypothetical protein